MGFSCETTVKVDGNEHYVIHEDIFNLEDNDKSE